MDLLDLAIQQERAEPGFHTPQNVKFILESCLEVV